MIYGCNLYEWAGHEKDNGAIKVVFEAVKSAFMEGSGICE